MSTVPDYYQFIAAPAGATLCITHADDQMEKKTQIISAIYNIVHNACQNQVHHLTIVSSFKLSQI